MSTSKSIGSPGGYSASTCGYCSLPGTRSSDATSWHSATLNAEALTCDVYQKMIDRGWRRSGSYCYKPNLRLSCCPQYTIKLNAVAFKPSRSQRKLINRWNRFILQGDESDAMQVDGPRTKPFSSPKSAPIFTLTAAIHAAECSFHPEVHFAHKFEIKLEPSSFSLEKFVLYQKYQTEIHHDLRGDPEAFQRFLVYSPLLSEKIPYASNPPSHLPTAYGSYHQLYYLDDQLIALSVIDILPTCVSSVYFMYDKTWERFSLGKLSALQETSLAREMQEAGAPDMSFLYMGYYIHTCPKMKYKGDYSPSYLADPETNEWYSLEICIPMLEKNRYACFSDASHSLRGKFPADQPLEIYLPELDSDDLDDIYVTYNSRHGAIEVPIQESPHWDYKPIREELEVFIYGLGVELAKEIKFSL